ncbi:hypothetical protein [Pseudomonas aeruginosa]|uniref:hypothetical protein n=1 Tax=Pseudomonas aeruginosa TaxID=287 RepID=UPI003D2DC94D|nr:hypothetical protein [Pseudomonas aeruginosa]
MKLPAVFSSFESLIPVGEQGGVIHFKLADQRGWTLEHPNGLLVALAVERDTTDDAWLRQAALWVASTAAGIDDSLQLDEQSIWLVRRHTLTIASTELEASIGQMLLLARWFSTLGGASPEVRDTLVSECLA